MPMALAGFPTRSSSTVQERCLASLNYAFHGYM